MKGKVAALVVAVSVALVGCRTGVRDEKGWEKAVRSGQPCSELFDIRDGLPESVDRAPVDADQARIGCVTADSERTDR